MRFFMTLSLTSFLLGSAASISSAAEDCKSNPQGAGCPPVQIDWKLKTYDVGEGGYYDYGQEEPAVPPPTYSSETPAAYPFGNTVKLQNGVTCRRDGVAVSCQ